MKIIILFSILLIFCMPFVSKAQVLFVDSNFSGENPDGSKDLPYKSIQQAVDAAVNGDEILIRKGTYLEQIEITTDSITIRNYPGEKVTIKGTEPILSWEHVGEEVYKAIVPWDISENDQSNQVFVDGEMIHLARWPKETSAHWVTKPTVAYVDAAENSGQGIIITENDFNEPKERWKNGMVWINLSNGHDGNGWTGRATYISSSSKNIKIEQLTGSSSGVSAASGYQPWAVKRGSEYYLFNPAPEGVYATGGPQALLARGEWWKNGDSLFVRLPDGGKPAESIIGPNFVEVKKRIWAFIPAISDQMHHVTIKGLNLFAATITTDKDYLRGNTAVNSYDNVIDSISGKYIMHFINQGGHYGLQWKGRCGIILSGLNNTLKNSKIKYSAGSAVSAFGRGHKILNNAFYDVNYQVTEAGAINSGGVTNLYDPEVAHNLLYNCPHLGIAINKMYSTDPAQFGLIRIHHNVIMNFMLRSNDGGAINASAGRNWDNVRVDHNIIANSNKYITFGIYTDYGGEALLDHNVIYNVDRPIGMNRYSVEQNPPVGTSDGGPMGEIRVFNNTVIADQWSKQGIQNNHVNPSGEGMFYKNNIISNRIQATLELAVLDSNLYIGENQVETLFEDYANHDFRLKAGASAAIDKGIDVAPFNDTIINDIPDIGAYEFGADPWKAGPEGVATNVKINAETGNVYQRDTVYFTAQAYTSGFILMDPQPEMTWFTDGSGRIEPNGMYIADSADNNATVFVMIDSLLVESKTFRIREQTTGLESVNEGLTGENNELAYSLFPNPARKEIFIKFSENTSQDMIIAIFDMQGRMLDEKRISGNPGNQVFSYNIDSLKEGIYYVKIISGTKTGSRKFMVTN